MTRKSSTETLIAAVRILARDIESGDGVANAAIAEAADRLAELQSHVMSEHLRDAAKMVEQQARIAELEKSVEWWQGCAKDCGDVINDGIESRQQLRDKLAELEAQAAIGRRAVEMLRGLEWVRPVIDRNGFLGRGCINCCCGRFHGHADSCELSAILRDAEQAAPHSDDLAVDRFAAAMKAKLAAARANGRGGWDDPEQCSVEFLAKLLIGHVRKGNAGNFEDIANLAMMLHQRGAYPAVLERAAPEPATVAVDAVALEALRVTVDAYDKAWADDMPQRQKIAALHMAEAARRLLEGVNDGH